METIASFVASFEPERYSGSDAAQLVTTFTRAERLCGAGKTLAASRASEANLHHQTGHRTPAEWLAGVTGESVGEAVGVLHLGEALLEQGGVDEAYRSGRLSGSRARMVSDTVKVNPGREAELVKGAQTDTFRQLKERCLRAKAEGRSAEDEARAHAAIHRSRRCRTWTDPEGAFRLEALLAPDAGARLLASLDPEADRVFHQARRAGRQESPDAYRADALLALITGRGTTTDPGSADPGTADPGSAGPASTIGSGSGGKARAGGRGRARATGTGRTGDTTVHVRIDLDRLLGDGPGRKGRSGGGICEIPGVGPIPVERARELMGDALLELIITNGVDVTTVCRLGRSIPVALRSALFERDRTCVVPGCDRTAGLECDHWVVPFAEGGPVSLDNLARLCTHHHRLRTHRGFRLSNHSGTWIWEPPDHPKPTTTRPTRPSRSSPTGRRESRARTTGADPPLFTVEE